MAKTRSAVLEGPGAMAIKGFEIPQIGHHPASSLGRLW